jgi:soluble lytic murein transglycosylase-like protein
MTGQAHSNRSCNLNADGKEAMRTAVLFAVLLFFCAGEAQADALIARERALHGFFDYPCGKFGIPKSLAMAIARQESGMNPLVLNLAGKDVHPKNAKTALAVAQWAERRGMSYDVGLMQINSYWIRKYKISLHTLLNPRNNIYVGCWILRQEILRHGYSWKAVGRYHSPTDSRADAYAKQVRGHLKKILVAYNSRR